MAFFGQDVQKRAATMRKLQGNPRGLPFQYGPVDSVDNGARYLNISRTKTWSLISDGILPCIRIGGRTMLRKDDCDALLARSLQRVA
jgi:excisionase family DNA binding protein